MTDLPKEYDAIIAGTGLTETILAAALSRIGKSVLHLDRNQFYGGEFSSHSLTALIEWTDKLNSRTDSIKSSIQFDSFKCNNDLTKYILNVEYEWSPKITEDAKNKLLNLSRKFSIDLSPNIFYSRGQFIELLISSEVSKYCEFRLVNQILTKNLDKNLEKVPTSRSEVFKTNQLSMIEKRIMMQFIQSCVKDNEFQDFAELTQLEEISFKQLIKNKKFSSSIQNYLVNAVAMCPSDDLTALDGLKQIKKFLNSVGRFGESPFLYSLYGTGELPQCFCRMAAVFGAIYHLNLTIDSFNVNTETNLIETVQSKNESEEIKFSCKHLILEASYIPLDLFSSDCATLKKISKCVLITDKSIFPVEENNENISLLYLPISEENKTGIYCLEASFSSQSCPQGYYLIYMFCEKSTDHVKDDFQKVISNLFSDSSLEDHENEKPNILFSFYMTHFDSNDLIQNLQTKSIPFNLFATSGFKVELDFDFHVEQAKDIFKRVCPDEEFLPKPPDQEDIIFDNDRKTENNEVSLENVKIEPAAIDEQQN